MWNPVLFGFSFLLLGYPILLFENASATDAMGKAYNIAKDNYGTFFCFTFRTHIKLLRTFHVIGVF
jgi:hypothetical protein